ncbi:hypothetical protein C8J57DRAFT_1227611 [Mycena rebaudengoi]|nr:hypothetical protein C8J57DRAFT_1227611 [Mycena rebaudengoi]
MSCTQVHHTAVPAPLPRDITCGSALKHGARDITKHGNCAALRAHEITKCCTRDTQTHRSFVNHSSSALRWDDSLLSRTHSALPVAPSRTYAATQSRSRHAASHNAVAGVRGPQGTPGAAQRRPKPRDTTPKKDEVQHKGRTAAPFRDDNAPLRPRADTAVQCFSNTGVPEEACTSSSTRSWLFCGTQTAHQRAEPSPVKLWGGVGAQESRHWLVSVCPAMARGVGSVRSLKGHDTKLRAGSGTIHDAYMPYVHRASRAGAEAPGTAALPPSTPVVHTLHACVVHMRRPEGSMERLGSRATQQAEETSGPGHRMVHGFLGVGGRSRPEVEKKADMYDMHASRSGPISG